MRELILESYDGDIELENKLMNEQYDDYLIGTCNVCGYETHPAYDFNELINFIIKENKLTETEAFQYFNINILDKNEYVAFIKYTNETVDEISEYNSAMLFMDGLDSALVGFKIQKDHEMTSVYDQNKCIDALMEQDMEYEDAMEYFDYNILGAYVGIHTPAILTTF